MIRCRSCRRGITRLLREEKARAVRRREASFTFRCPHCREIHQISIDAAGELTLVLLESGGIATPSLLDALFTDPEIRRALWGEDRGSGEA